VRYSTTICIRIKDITLHIYPLYNKTLIVIALCMYPEVWLILMCESTMGDSSLHRRRMVLCDASSLGTKIHIGREREI
jgi:hypothetical protein